MNPSVWPATAFPATGETDVLDVGSCTEVSVGTMSLPPSSSPKMTGFTLGDSTTTVVVGATEATVVGVVVDVVDVVEVVDVVVVVEVVVTTTPAPVNRTTGENNRCCTSEMLTALIPATRAS